MKFKTFFSGCAAVLALILFTGCGGDAPEEVMKQWHEALIAGDLEKANALSTTETQTLNKFAIALLKNERDNNGGPQIRDIRSATVEKVTINDDRAVLHYHTDKHSGKTMKLVKQNGKWLVDEKK